MTPDEFMAMKSRVGVTADDAVALIEYASQLEAENAELRKVLAWYGDEGNWLELSNFAPIISEAVSDKGQRAREAQRQGGK